MFEYLDVGTCRCHLKINKEKFQSWTVSPSYGNRLESLHSICTALPACNTCVCNKDRINICYTVLCHISKCCCEPAVVSRHPAQLLQAVYIVCVLCRTLLCTCLFSVVTESSRQTKVYNFHGIGCSIWQPCDKGWRKFSAHALVPFM